VKESVNMATPENGLRCLCLYMFCYNNEDKWNQCKEFFKSLIASGNMTIDNDGTGRMESYHWSDAVNKILNKGKRQRICNHNYKTDY
jgi:hypothetical protein